MKKLSRSSRKKKIIIIVKFLMTGHAVFMFFYVTRTEILSEFGRAATV